MRVVVSVVVRDVGVVEVRTKTMRTIRCGKK